MSKIILALIMIAILFTIASADEIKKGSISGTVIDSETRSALPGVSVILLGTEKGAVSSSDGEFTIENVPVGNYSLKFRLLGYEVMLKADIIVRPKRITFVKAELNESAIEVDEVVITTGYFAERQDAPASNVSFSNEEIRRMPGTAGDVSRMIMGLPSIAKYDNTQNTLYVRGGASFENGFYVDNIEIPNINHFPEQSSSGGPVGLINVDLVSDVEFHSGAFPARYGDRLSSVMDIDFRDGNREEFDAQLDLGFAGFGGGAEGPIGDKGSWILAGRKSFLDLIVKAIGEDDGSVPNYGDIHGKVTYDLNGNNQITLLNILSIDDIADEIEDAIEEEEKYYDSFNMTANTAGINWRYLWGANGYSNTSISHTLYDYNYTGYDTKYYYDHGAELMSFDFNSTENEFKLRNVNFIKLNNAHKLELGVEAKYSLIDYNNYYGEYYDELGNVTPAYSVDDNINETKLHGFFSYTVNPFDRLSVTAGTRFSYFTYNENSSISPRLSVNYILSSLTTLNAAAGIYYQNLPMPILAQNEANKDLKDPKAYHYVFGINHMLTENTRLTIEVFDKEYRDFPLDSLKQQIFIVDDIAGKSVYLAGNPLVSSGEAYARGIEFMVQKKLAKQFYGMISGAYSRTRYKGYDGIWYDRAYDNQFNFSIEGGYKPNNKWEFSTRWIYAGGAPYTPFDIAASETAGRGIYDSDRINAERLPDYHSMNIRFDRRFNFTGSNLIFYLSVWNVYGRKNIGTYEWNEIANEQREVEQWSTLPIFGIEYEF